VELNDFFFKALYYWIIVFYLNISNLHIFLDLFSSSSLVFLLYTFYILGLRLLRFS
jgi:hypothetical protein